MDEHADATASQYSAVVGPTLPDEERTRVDERRFHVVAIVAGVLLAVQALPHLFTPILVVPTFSQMFSQMGGELPAPTAFMVAMGPWLSVILAAVDALVFWGFYRLARKYWIGLLFAPLFAVGVLSGLFVWVLYMPMFDVVTLIK